METKKSIADTLKLGMDITNSIRRLSKMLMRVVELEGEKFWMCVPSEPLLYQIGIAASVGMFNPKPGELACGHLAYQFTGDSISYVFRHSSKLWTEKGMGREQYLGQLAVAGHDNVDKAPILITDRTSFYFRPMLVPIGRNGEWDQTFHQSVPDGELTCGGFLAIRYTNDQNTVEHIVGDHMYDDAGRTLPELSFPTNAIYNQIELISENDRIEPMAWRSFGNVLVCTRRFMVSASTEDFYRMGLLPQFEHTLGKIVHPGTITT